MTARIVPRAAADEASDSAAATIGAYCETTCGVVPPRRLGAMVRTLEAAGLRSLAGQPPKETPFLHPLVIPVAAKEGGGGGGGAPSTGGSEGGVVGLLRWPKASLSSDLPVVFCSASTGGLTLLASKVSDYVKRVAAESDFLGLDGSAAVLEAANQGLAYEEQYEAGSVANFGRGLDRYCILRIAAFPDSYMGLVVEHKERGDVASALITCEKACEVFAEYGALDVFQARALAQEPGYDLEARDAARTALGKPLWTSGEGGAGLLEVAQLAGKADLAEYAADLAKAEGAKEAEAARMGQPAATSFLDRAARAMDHAVLDAFAAAGSEAAPVDWASQREALATLYAQGDLTQVANLVRGD